MNHKRDRNTRGKRFGAAAVELAVCLPAIVLLILGSIEACTMVFVKQSLHIAAYEGVRRAIRYDSSEQSVLERCEQTIKAVNLRKDIASLLGLRENASAIYMESVTYNDRNIPVEFLCCYFRGDKFTFEVELGRYHLTE